VSSNLDLAASLRRARRTAALARATLALAGIGLALTGHWPAPTGWLAASGFTILFASALVELRLPRPGWLVLEESLAPLSAVLIVGFGPERVTDVLLVWMACVACGVLARGGRQHWYGRAVLLITLVLPVGLHRSLSASYGVACLATIALLLTCGRVTRELRAVHDRARDDADHDGLTGLLSRDAFRARLDRVAAELLGDPADPPAAPGTAVLLLDLDNFGQVNKSAGHAAGDALLLAVAGRLRESAGPDDVVGRLGGDEFAVIMRHADPEQLAGELLAQLAREVAAAGVQLSAGLALVPRDGEDADALLRAGDVALRVAKRAGHGGLSVYAGVSFSESGPGGAREALMRLIDGDGLSIAVQPIVAVPDGRTHAFEALARFTQGGASSPLHWFSLADEFELRDQLELACLHAALQVFERRPLGALLSVNLSGALLPDPRVRALLERAGPLDGLILEMTENSLLVDTPGIHTEISRLIGLGVHFAIDDVGAGYSGLLQITTLRPSYLKLDRSLISGIDGDPARGALVAAMVGYANQTGGHLIAEGVENAAELEMLVALGVRLVQGFHLARPGWPWPQVRSPAERLADPLPALARV
jgi:diguanylate cyclase (GGDEF)-like protein